MTVTTTVADIIGGAYARSSKNNVGTISDDTPELLRAVHRAMSGLYAFAARLNPTFFAELTAISYVVPGWERPANAESIFRIEDDADHEVVVVPYDDKTAELGKPAVYFLGGVFRSAGNSLDPVDGDLTFYYSKRPVQPVTVSDTLDSLWAETYNELLILETAIYLALKDGRLDELSALKSERDRWAILFAAFLEHAIANERRRYGTVRTIISPSIIPIGQLLAGGSTAQFAEAA